MPNVIRSFGVKSVNSLEFNNVLANNLIIKKLNITKYVGSNVLDYTFHLNGFYIPETNTERIVKIKLVPALGCGDRFEPLEHVYEVTSSSDIYAVTRIRNNTIFDVYINGIKITTINAIIKTGININITENIDSSFYDSDRKVIIKRRRIILEEDYGGDNGRKILTVTGPNINETKSCVGLVDYEMYLYDNPEGVYTFTLTSMTTGESQTKTYNLVHKCDDYEEIYTETPPLWNSSYSGGAKFQLLSNKSNTFNLKNIPDPCVSPEPQCDENAPALLPEDINNLLQILGQYLLPNALNPVIEKVNNFTSNVNSANNLAGQYGFSTQATKEERAKAKYDGFVEKINQSKQELLTESSNLKTVASNILNEVKNTSNINKQLLSKESDFNSYKLKVEELVDEFNYLVTDENTFSLAEASAVYGQEVGLLAEIIEDYANRVLPVKVSNEEELEQYQDDENGFEKIQTTKGLIRYLKARIEVQKTRLNKVPQKIQESLEKDINELIINQAQQQGEFAEVALESLFEANLLDKDTLEIDLSKIEHNNSFNTLAKTTGDILLETFVNTKNDIGSYISTAVNFYGVTEVYNTYAQPIVEIANKSPVIKEALKVREVLNKVVKKEGTDKLANALAAADASNWSTLPVQEQQERISNYKNLLETFVTGDTLLAGGATKVLSNSAKMSQLNELVVATKKLNEVTKSKLAKSANKLSELQGNASKVTGKSRVLGNKIASKQAGMTKLPEKGDSLSSKITSCTKSSCGLNVTIKGNSKGGMQGKHYKTAHNYEPGKSFLTIDINKLQELVNKFAGTGQVVDPKFPKGSVQFRERVDFGEVIGMYKEIGNPTEYPTTKGIIHYSKSGCHVVPAKP